MSIKDNLSSMGIKSTMGITKSMGINDSLSSIGISRSMAINDSLSSIGISRSTAINDSLSSIGISRSMAFKDSLSSIGIASMAFKDSLSSVGIANSMAFKDNLSSIGISRSMAFKDNLSSVGIANFKVLQDTLKCTITPIDNSEFIKTNKNENYKELVDIMRESEEKKNRIKAEFYNNTRITAESAVKSEKYTEQIMKTNEMLLKKLQGIDSSLNKITNEFITHSKDIQLLEIDQSEKLEQMIQLLKNPSDESLIDDFKDMPAQLIIGLTLQALIKSLGIG